MAVPVNYYKCSSELYNKYLAADKLVDTNFYLVEDITKNIRELYLGKILLSSEDESFSKIKEAIQLFDQQFKQLAPIASTGLIEDLSMNWDTELIFNGGSADV